MAIDFGGDGGGFMAAGGNSQSPYGSSGAARPEGIVPACINQLKHAEKSTEYFRINGREVDKVTLVGVVREVADTSTQMKYLIEDHTGTIAVVHWLSSAGGEEDQAGEAQKQRMMAENREGQYVSLVGKINEMENGDRKLTAFSVEAIKDCNQVTHHLLSVIQAYCVHKHGYKQSHNLGVPLGAGDMAMGGMAAAAGPATAINGGDYAAHAVPTAGAGSSLPPTHQAVLAIIGRCHDDQGVSINAIQTELEPRGITHSAILKALDVLTEEGSVYTTVDDEHYRSTEHD